MEKTKLIDLLKKDFPSNIQEVENFAKWTLAFINQKNSKQIRINAWAEKLSESTWAEMFKKVANEKLWFDWKHITYNKQGISYDYIAYKNKMFIVYPDSTIDINLVYEGDEFSFIKENGIIIYTHKFTDPFLQTDNWIKWWYCIIKNERWEFITLLSKADFEKHKRIAKWDFIWKAWYKEMCLKTLLKKAVKVHFNDIYEQIDNEDNKQIDLEKLEKDLEKENKKELDKKEKDLQEKYKNLDNNI